MAREPSRPPAGGPFERAEATVAGAEKVGNYRVMPIRGGLRPEPLYEVWHPEAKSVGYAAGAADCARLAAGLTLLDDRDATIETLAEALEHERAKTPPERLLQEIAACLVALSDLEERREVHLCERHLVRALASLGSLVDVELAVDAVGPDTNRPASTTDPR